MAEKHPVKVSVPVLLLDRETVSSLLTLDDCIAAVEAGFLAHVQGRSHEPKLMYVDAEGGEFHTKTGCLRGNHAYFACKINGGFFGNKTKFGLPNIIGLILLSDGRSGAPRVVIESGIVTELCTGAATAVAPKYFGRPESQMVTPFRKGSSARLPDLSIGSRVGILPNHACVTATQFDRYHVVGDEVTVTSVWERFSGW
jgi:alanine dehydrogenase